MRRLLTTVVLAVAVGPGCTGFTEDPTQDRPAAHAEGFSAPGRIEGLFEPIEIGASIDGVLDAVLETEGERVSAGQVLARVSCFDIQAAMSAAQADTRALQMRLAILRNGTRREDVDAASARAAAALELRHRAAGFHERMQQLWDADKVISADELDRAMRDREAASATYEAALAEARRAEAGPLPEEVAEAEAQVEGAQFRSLELRNRLARCEVRAPVAGTVLKRLLLPGENVSALFPRPVLTLVDLSAWTVRAEVDEHDIDKVIEDMPVLVSAPAWRSTERRGVVKAISQAMGRRRVRSGDPAEKSDRDVREVSVALDGHDYVIGLRVDVRFPSLRGR